MDVAIWPPPEGQIQTVEEVGPAAVHAVEALPEIPADQSHDLLAASPNADAIARPGFLGQFGPGNLNGNNRGQNNNGPGNGQMFGGPSGGGAGNGQGGVFIHPSVRLAPESTNTFDGRRTMALRSAPSEEGRFSD
jgi:hypothetical protein